MKRYIRRAMTMGIVSAVLALSGCGERTGRDPGEISVGNQHMEASVHDPSIVKDGERI